MKINNSIAVIRGLCLGFIILSIILSVWTIFKPTMFKWDSYIISNSLAVVSVFLGLKNEVRARSLSGVEFKNEVIHAIEHVLHLVGWLSGLGGLVSAIISLTPWLLGDFAPMGFVGGILLALLGLLFLHVSWNLRRNFRRIIPD